MKSLSQTLNESFAANINESVNENWSYGSNIPVFNAGHSKEGTTGRVIYLPIDNILDINSLTITLNSLREYFKMSKRNFPSDKINYVGTIYKPLNVILPNNVSISWEKQNAGVVMINISSINKDDVHTVENLIIQLAKNINESVNENLISDFLSTLTSSESQLLLGAIGATGVVLASVAADKLINYIKKNEGSAGAKLIGKLETLGSSASSTVHHK